MSEFMSTTGKKLNENACNNKLIVCAESEESINCRKQNNRFISDDFSHCLPNTVFSLCLVHTIHKHYERYEGEMTQNVLIISVWLQTFGWSD